MTEDRYCCVICAKADPSENATTCRPCLARIDDNLEAIVILTRAVGVPVRCMGAHRDADGRRCDWRLYTDGTAIVHCPACGTQWTPEDLLDACEFELMPASVLVLLSDDPAAARKRINNWTTRGRLTVHGDIAATGGGKRLPLYRLGEYRALAGLKFTVGESA